MRLRVLIADDEPLSRQRVRRFLRGEPGIEIVAECADGKATVAAICKTSPDLLFLDVLMPEMDGFGVIEALNGHRPPAIVFVTAHDRFAVRAFETHGVDYLLKPFDRQRFQIALQRARERVQRDLAPNDKSSLVKLLTSVAAHSPPLERLTVRSRDRICFVKVAEIDWISAADNYVELHVGPKAHLLRMTLAALGNQLPPNRFVRASRSLLVNCERIIELRSKAHGDFLILLRDGRHLLGTRNYRHNFAPLLGTLQ